MNGTNRYSRAARIVLAKAPYQAFVIAFTLLLLLSTMPLLKNAMSQRMLLKRDSLTAEAMA